MCGGGEGWGGGDTEILLEFDTAVITQIPVVAKLSYTTFRLG